MGLLPLEKKEIVAIGPTSADRLINQVKQGCYLKYTQNATRTTTDTTLQKTSPGRRPMWCFCGVGGGEFEVTPVLDP